MLGRPPGRPPCLPGHFPGLRYQQSSEADRPPHVWRSFSLELRPG